MTLQNRSFHTRSTYPSNRSLLILLHSKNGSRTRDPSGCTMLPVAIGTNNAYILQITEQFKRLYIPIIVDFTPATRKKANNTGGGSLP